MITLTSQAAISFWLLAFGLVAWQVARLLPGQAGGYRFGWALTGCAFLVQGANSAFHDIFSIVAYRAGPESFAWKAVIRWHPALNHSRTFLLTTFCLVLAVSMMRMERGKPEPRLRTAALLMVCGMVMGGLAGWVEPEFSGLTHFTAVALWDVMELLAMLGLLLAALTTGRMDRGLWFCLSVNAFVLALSVLWFAALSRIDISGQWAPMRYHIHFTKAALYVVMTIAAYGQLVRVRRHERLRGFFEPSTALMQPSLHG